MTENNEQQNKKPNKILNAIKWVFKGIWLGVECILYLISTIFGIELLIGIFNDKKKK